MIEMQRQKKEITPLEQDILDTWDEALLSCSSLSVETRAYNIPDHLFPDMARSVDPPAQMYSAQSAPESEFVQAAKQAGMDRTLDVLDEHMACIRALYPKEYNAILRLLRD